MELYLFRHGIAEDGKPGHSDAERVLTAEGRRKVAEVVRAARKSGVELSLIISSPYKRAIETAQLAAEGFDYKGEIVQTITLVPHGTPEKVWSELRDYRDQSAILMAGHEPLMSQMVAYFLASEALRVDMKKAALVRIDVGSMGAAPHGTLRWMIYPKLV